MKKLSYLLPLLAVLFAACEKEDSTEPGVTTLAATNVEMFTATLNAEMSLPEQLDSTFDFGFQVSLNESFYGAGTRRYKVDDYNSDKQFSYNLRNLSPGSTYFVRAYMINQNTFYVGSTVTVATTDIQITTGDIMVDNNTVISNTNAHDEDCIYGVCYSTHSALTVQNSEIATTGSIDAYGNYTVTLTGIPYWTIFYYCSFVGIRGEYYYGEEKQFVKEVKLTEGDVVDLGLSVKWATCNVGAIKPEEYGDYFAWAEISTKTDYSWSTYKYSAGKYYTDTMTKYCSKSSFGYNGFTDGKTVLDMEDDAARVNRGGSWRIPTVEEWEELKDNCNWSWTAVNGVNGYVIESKKPGYTDKRIFLPAAGIRYDTNLNGVGIYSCYCSSSLDADIPNSSWVFFVSSAEYNTSSRGRYYGRPVRPVCRSFISSCTR